MEEKIKRHNYKIIWLKSLLYGRNVRETFSQMKTEELCSEELLYAIRYLILQDKLYSNCDKRAKLELREALFLLKDDFIKEHLLTRAKYNHMLVNLNIASTNDVEVNFYEEYIERKYGSFLAMCLSPLTGFEDEKETIDFVCSSYQYDFQLTQALYEERKEDFEEKIQYLKYEPFFCLGYLRKVIKEYSEFLEDPDFLRRLSFLAHQVGLSYKQNSAFNRSKYLPPKIYVDEIIPSIQGKYLEKKFEKLNRDNNKKL